MNKIAYELGQNYRVKVIKIVKAGIIVDLLDYPGMTGFIHISKLSTQFVDDINNFVEVGDTYTAVAFEGRFGEAELSLLSANIKSKVSRTPKHKRNNEYNPKSKSFNNTSRKPIRNLDNMIDDANKVFDDKQFTHNRRNRGRRK